MDVISAFDTNSQYILEGVLTLRDGFPYEKKNELITRIIDLREK